MLLYTYTVKLYYHARNLSNILTALSENSFAFFTERIKVFRRFPTIMRKGDKINA